MAVQELRARDASLSLGVTLNLTVAEPVDPEAPTDVDAARRIDGQFNRWFLDPIFRGEYPTDVVRDIRAVAPEAIDALDAATAPGDLEVISTPLQALGVNYYHGEFVGGSPDPQAPLPGDAPTDRPTGSPFPSHEGIHWHERGLPRTNMHWEIEPAGLTTLLERVWTEYAEPAGTVLYVTENGAAFDDVLVQDGAEARVHDARRVDFLRDHLGAILDAREAGVDVRGYFYWSLLDNFEWAWGYDKRFGIVHVDYDTQVRTLKDSAREYRRVIAARAIDVPAARSAPVAHS